MERGKRERANRKKERVHVRACARKRKGDKERSRDKEIER